MKNAILSALCGFMLFCASSLVQAACEYQPISIGQTVNGTLNVDDCTDSEVDGSMYYADYYQFSGTAGQQIYVSLTSTQIDAFLFFILPDGAYTYDSSGGGGYNARIPANSGYLTLPQSGVYLVMASSDVPLQTGSYVLKIGTDSTTSPGAGTPVIEFYNTNLNHYFMTADAQEAAGIDNGAAGPGWRRTGYSFNAALTQSQATTSAKPVCRFYGTPGVGPNSHFYTVDQGECDLVKKDPGWFYEGIALYAQPLQYGACPSGTTPVYRVYNNRWMYNDSNHRFITDSRIYQQMVAQGWSSEGPVMCAISAAGPASTGTRTTVGSSGGTVSSGGLTINIPSGTFSAPTAVTVSPGTVTGDYPDATVVSDVYEVELENDTYQPIVVQLSAKGAVTGRVFAVVASDTYNFFDAVPVYRGQLLDTVVVGSSLSVTIPQSAVALAALDVAKQEKPKADATSKKAKRRFTIWFITGYDFLESDHFGIRFPVKPCNYVAIRDYLDSAELAYKKLITDIKFSPSGPPWSFGLSWPMRIEVKELAPGRYGEAGYGDIGRFVTGSRSLYLALNKQYCGSTAQTDLDEMKATIGHEFFHTLQYVYDPHWAARESVFGSPFGWLYDASSTWFEGEMLNNPSYESPVFQSNRWFYKDGLEHGGVVDAQEHGYGASSFLRYLTAKFGNDLLLSVWTNVNSSSSSSTAALADANVRLASEWATFAEQYLSGNTAFGWSAPGSDFQYNYSDAKPSHEFSKELYSLSAMKVLLKFNDLKQTKKYTLSLEEGKNSFIKAYLYQGSTKVAEFSDKYQFDATPGSAFFAFVINSNDAAPYLTPTLVKLKLSSGPQIDYISPDKGPVDTEVTIMGSGFGKSSDTRSVYFNGLKASNVSWSSDTLVLAKVPNNASSGDVVVEVNNEKSNGVNFEVIAQCSATQNAGGDTPDTRTIELGKKAGTFDFSYQTYSVKDQILVRYEGTTLFDTGCVGASGTKSLTYSGNSTQITVQVIPNCSGPTTGTAWNYTVSCP